MLRPCRAGSSRQVKAATEGQSCRPSVQAARAALWGWVEGEAVRACSAQLRPVSTSAKASEAAVTESAGLAPRPESAAVAACRLCQPWAEAAEPPGWDGGRSEKASEREAFASALT